MKQELKEYNKKRDFSKTNEPKGQKHKTNKNLQYVLQYHEATNKHYDFRLEWNGVLLSWAIPKGPSLNTKDKRLAIQTEDHPYTYKDFEGIIPSNLYGAGTVMIFDKGTWIPSGDVNKGLKKGELKFALIGDRLKGLFVLIKIKDNNWLLIKEKDEYVKNSSGIARYKTSVKSGLTMKEIANPSNPFTKPDVELALLNETVPTSNKWIYEIKYDGYRIVSEIEQDKVRLLTRNHLNYTSKFPIIREALLKLFKNKAAIIDGEVVALDEYGRSSFQLLQNNIKNKDNRNIVYMVFDILSYEGKDLRDLPLIERKKILEKIIAKKDIHIIYSKHYQKNGQELYEKAKELSLEGIIAKDKNSKYIGKRTGDWIKIKCRKSDEFIIGGYQLSNKNKNSLKSILVEAFENGKLHYKGKVGTSFTLKERKELLTVFNKYKRKKTPFSDYQKSPSDIVYIRPQLVCEIEFMNYTEKGLLRQGSFKGIRVDKKSNEISKDNQKEVIITHQDKIIYPKLKITKGDIANYYLKVAKYMMPFIENRFITEIRCNNGITKQFFKKHQSENKEGIKVIKQDGKDYFMIDNEYGLINEVQQGSVEFHISAQANEKFDYMVFDLDPDEGLDIKDVRKCAKDLHKILNKLKLKSFIKTSGGKGYHIVVPFSGISNYKKFRDFAQSIANLMEKTWPNLYTSKMSKAKRKGKIFVDWMRNNKNATSVAPYSLRAREKATVSMPIFWNEVDTIDPDEINIFSAIKRLNKNPWKNFFNAKNKQRF